ncbi:hypothetical protein GCM10011371_27160 [Novosphingobium marinum]|uniref:Gamma-glutamylcyclotransferase (GGCT)/AIG2-like uncharacterized protein YtfP n=1 Tax=Novosphingobium marinum TaxID=1514948 RepID=A0A7Z0BU10_9SPHN|nr:gamma-glutamylcyclotransferase family protein [Novosphingobium marinum]NYH94668.1 gamma-glutamylcyclotransferase (GGCT)/AIG2-like uncharacterized protein YtfP [Novosphingobium marinum]GGC38308.1 hypothetical protein GCM10011371_27160 [Novosphingobium marinum]
MTRRFFFYGTLLAGADTPMAAWVGDRLTGSSPGTCAGSLRAIPAGSGWYPALLRGTGRVRGCCCELALTPEDLRHLDRYEGAFYHRRPVQVVQGNGSRTFAQTYLWRGPMPRGSRRISGGDFLGWLAQHGLAAFA